MDDELQFPHCGNDAVIVSDNPSSVPWGDGDCDDIECESCGKELTVKCIVTRIEWEFVDEYGEEMKYEE